MGIEQRQFVAGQAQAVCEVVVEFFAEEAADMVAYDEALAQGLMDRHGESAAQFGQPDEQQAQAPVGVHVEVGE